MCVLLRINIFILYIDDGIFLGKSECQLSNIEKVLQDVGSDIED